MRTCIDDCTGNQRSDERGCFPDYREEGEEEEFFAAGRDFADHNLRVRVPRADEKAIESLIDPELPNVVEAECLSPDAYHTPTVTAQ